MVVGTSLPPHVPGNIQGWLHAELLEFTDAIGALQVVHGSVEWWGQDASGVLLEVRQSGRPSREAFQGETVANAEFPIRSSPKRFMAYLQDMQFLRVHLFHPGTPGASKQMGLCEIRLLPFLRGPDSDYKLQLDGHFPVVRSHSDRMVIGQLRLILHTEWGEHAELRSKQDALSSFEAHEWKAKLDQSRPPKVPMERCRNCSSDLEATCRFCGQCGARHFLDEDSIQGLHLQVHLCGLRVRAAALPKDEGLCITYRLGVKEEVSVTAVLQDEGHELCALLGSVRTSNAPIWPDGAGGEPTLKSLHFHFWQNSRLLGLSTVKLPATSTENSFRCLLLSTDLEVSSVSSGEMIGLLKLALYVGPETLQNPSELTALPGPLESELPDRDKTQPASVEVELIHRNQSGQLPKPSASNISNPQIQQAIADTASTAATLWLAASGISVDKLLAECHGVSRVEGYPSASIPSTLDLDDFCQALLKTVDGLTPHQASLLAAEAKSGPGTVSLDLWKGVFREASARVEAAIDLLQEVIGPEELGWLVEQLAALGMFAALPNTQLVALLAQKRSWQGPTWGMVEEMLRLLDPTGKGEVPARPLARLLSRRAEVFWQNHSEPAVAAVETKVEFKLNEDSASFVAPQLFAARQLISALLCLIRAGELDVNVVTEQLDAAAVQVSERKPALWCAQSPEAVALAAILETDAEGTSRALQVWHGLHLPTSASAAVQALRSLSAVEHGTMPRLRAQKIIQELASRSGFGSFQPQSFSLSFGSSHVFQALLSIGMGPEQLRSRLRTTCGAAGPSKLYLDQFAACLQKSGVTMAWADLLEVGRQWAPEGFLDADALYADHKAWLASRSPGPEALSDLSLASFGQLSRLDLPPYVLFACLDAVNQGHVSEETLRKLEEWPSPVAPFVAGAQLLYDPSGNGVVTYAHFRRFCNYLDRLRPCGSSGAGALQEARTQIRQALVELCGGRHDLAEQSSRTSRGLDAPAELSGLVRLLQDVSDLKRDLAETLAGAFLAVRAPNSTSSSYRGFLIMARQCQVLLRRHVDDLFKACLAASVDLELVMSDLMPGPMVPGAVLGWDALLSALAARGVDISKMDTEEVACAIDASGRRAVPVCDIAASAKAFKTRHSSVLEHLAHRAPSDDVTGLFKLVKWHKSTP